jgi:hypothetical protein
MARAALMTYAQLGEEVFGAGRKAALGALLLSNRPVMNVVVVLAGMLMVNASAPETLMTAPGGIDRTWSISAVFTVGAISAV